MPNVSELGLRLRTHAREQNITMDALARHAEIKLPTLAAWCYGRRIPSPESVALLQDAFPEILENATYQELITIHVSNEPPRRLASSRRNQGTMMHINVNTFAQVLRDDMRAKGIKGTELASALGVSYSTFRHWLNGVKPNSRHLETLRAQYPHVFNGSASAHDADSATKSLISQETDRADALRVSNTNSAQPLLSPASLPAHAANAQEAQERTAQIECLFELLHYQLKWFVQATPLDRETLSNHPNLNNNMSFLGSLLTMLTGGEKHFQQWKQWTTVMFQPRNP